MIDPLTKVYKYDEVMPINSYQRTVWIVKFPNGCTQLHVWHDKAKIEDIVTTVKMTHPSIPFTVGAMDVGVFTLDHIDHSMSNARKVNQDLEIVVDI